MQMKLIAHRGNWQGPNDRENEPSYVKETLDRGYYVEVDVWFLADRLWLGHDRPKYMADTALLENPKVYVHAKSIVTLEHILVNHPKIHVFFHDQDEVTLTSQLEMWTFPGKRLTSRSVMVMPEWVSKSSKWDMPEGILGVCSDYLP